MGISCLLPVHLRVGSGRNIMAMAMAMAMARMIGKRWGEDERVGEEGIERLFSRCSASAIAVKAEDGNRHGGAVNQNDTLIRYLSEYIGYRTDRLCRQFLEERFGSIVKDWRWAMAYLLTVFEEREVWRGEWDVSRNNAKFPFLYCLFIFNQTFFGTFWKLLFAPSNVCPCNLCTCLVKFWWACGRPFALIIWNSYHIYRRGGQFVQWCSPTNTYVLLLLSTCHAHPQLRDTFVSSLDCMNHRWSTRSRIRVLEWKINKIHWLVWHKWDSLVAQQMIWSMQHARPMKIMVITVTKRLQNAYS